MADDLLIESIEVAGERIRKYAAALLRGDSFEAASLGLHLAVDLAASPIMNVDGPTAGALIKQKNVVARRKATRRKREDRDERILRKADVIRARRASGDTHTDGGADRG